MLVSTGTTTILIDNGLSYKQLRLRMEALGESPECLSALVVTHEHGDHVLGAGVLSRKHDIPVYMNRKTFGALPRQIGALPRVEFIEAGETLRISDMTLSSFSVSHDAADPMSFVLRNGSTQLGIATDLGHVTQLVRARLAGSHALVLESNYCPLMLQQSSYPPSIRQRISGSRGHLSNEAMNGLLGSLLHDALKLVVLVHVSQENNTEEQVLRLATDTLGTHPAELCVAAQDRPTPVFEVHG